MNPLLQKIGEEFGLSTLPPEKQEELLARIGGIIYKSVLMRALDQMSEVEQDEFDKILEQDKGPEEIFAFLKEKVPTIEQIIKEESEAFKKETMDVMNQVKE
ncbi:MAG: hypothetical protein QG669_502 [Patescibacteria group bacterium]|jgi:hypothetical protein|nr:hypothetical protein [Patescibacteria group bacterium]